MYCQCMFGLSVCVLIGSCFSLSFSLNSFVSMVTIIMISFVSSVYDYLVSVCYLRFNLSFTLCPISVALRLFVFSLLVSLFAVYHY